ncbi:YfbK domain-containing protein, partial [Neisseria sp. P0020.S005]
AKDSKLMEQAIPVGSKPLEQADKDTLLALAAASYAQALRGGEYNGKLGWSDIEKMVQQVQGDDPFELKSEFLQLVRIAAGNEKQSGPLVKE